jgi:hypothetical protein
MRPLIFTVASFVISIAFQLTMAKYGADIPDGWLLVLWIAPLAPLAWWIWTHDKLLSRREKIRKYFELHPWAASIIALATLVIVVSCIAAAGYIGWKMLKARHETANTGGQQNLSIPDQKETGSQPIPKSSTPIIKPIAKARPPHTPSISKSSSSPLRGEPAQTPAQPQTQTCAPGAQCAQSTGQSGGFTGQINLGPIERHLDAVQKAALQGLVIPSGVKVSVEMTTEGDSQAYGREIATALNLAPADSNLGLMYSSPGPPQGVTVRIHDKTELQTLIDFGRTLTGIIRAAYGVDSHVPSGEIRIVVGRVPLS